MMGETYNNVWGCTTNPYNTDYTPGGSSGGEAALIALGGSPLGVGTDIGGSIRMPAGMCGLYGLKPSAGRFPVLGIRPALPGQEAVRATVGPMAPDLESLELWSQVILESAPWERDPMVLNMPWRDSVTVPDKLSFGE
jgi:amidase